jgi:membrane protease YdiL (CAAX protease family)
VILLLLWQSVMTVGMFAAFGLQGMPDDLKSFGEGLEQIAFDGDVLGLSAFAAIFFVCPFCWFLGRLRPGFSGWVYLGNERVRWWQWPLWGGATVLCAMAFDALAPSLGIEGPDESMVMLARSTDVPFFLYLGVGVAAPLVEEFIFRGIVWRGWRASRLGVVGTMVLTSLLWASLHVQYPLLIIGYIFVLGLLLGWAREKTGSLWVPVGMHALNNGLATLQMLQL